MTEKLPCFTRDLSRVHSQRLKHTLPGAAILKVGLKDYDPVLSDDFIGETEIDIERRFFDERWKNLPHYPIETRYLHKQESSTATGKIRLWVEVFNQKEANQAAKNFMTGGKQEQNSLADSILKKTLTGIKSQDDATRRLHVWGLERKLWNISMMPPEELELRVIVWEVLDCPIDDPEGMTDIYVSCSMSSYKKGLTKKTDTHIRSVGFVL